MCMYAILSDAEQLTLLPGQKIASVYDFEIDVGHFESSHDTSSREYVWY